MAEFQEKTEQATPRKKQKAREKGQIARNRDLSSMASAGGIIVLLYFNGRRLAQDMSDMTQNFLTLQYGMEPLTVLRAASVETLSILLPFLGVAVVLAIGANVIQGGIVFKKFDLDPNKMNPLKGIKKIFSVNGLTEFLKSLLKFLVGGVILYLILRKDLYLFPSLTSMDLQSMISVSAQLLIKAILYALLCFLAISVVGYFLDRWRFEKDLRMSKEEVKEEHKESEGDPLIKAKIKSVQREAARKRMMQEVPKATVVITNPTHIAVALKYEDSGMSAPQVTAKGTGFIAEKIK